MAIGIPALIAAERRANLRQQSVDVLILLHGLVAVGIGFIQYIQCIVESGVVEIVCCKCVSAGNGFFICNIFHTICGNAIGDGSAAFGYKIGHGNAPFVIAQTGSVFCNVFD